MICRIFENGTFHQFTNYGYIDMCVRRVVESDMYYFAK